MKIHWDEWPPKQYPCFLVYEWFCPTCKRDHTAEFSCGELGDDDSENYDFHCECGSYFKKFWKVPQECRTRSGWRAAEGTL